MVDVVPGKDLFLSIRVQPSAQLDRLEDVLVVTKVTEQPPDVKDLGPIRASDIPAHSGCRLCLTKLRLTQVGNAIAAPAAAGAAGANPNGLRVLASSTGAATARGHTCGNLRICLNHLAGALPTTPAIGNPPPAAREQRRPAE